MNPFVEDPAWGWWIILYFFVGGLAAGCYFLATLIELFGRQEDGALARIGYRVAFPLVCLCGVLLIVDLDRPGRFWHMVLQSERVDEALAEGWPLGGWGNMAQAVMLKWWSPMSIGAQALGVFGLISLLSFLAAQWPGGRLSRILGTRIPGRIFKTLGSTIGLFVASYTGVLLTATNQPVWQQTDWIGPLFLTSAASTSIALLIVLGGRVSIETREHLERANLWALGMELIIFLIFLASLGGVLPYALRTMEGLTLVLGPLVLGLLIPLALHLRRSSDRGGAVIASLCALAGGFLLRFGIVGVAPAVLHEFPHVTPGDTEGPLWESWAGKSLLAGTLLFAVLMPVILKRRWELRAGQTAIAGLVSVLVMASVALYVFTPTRANAELNPVVGMTISPEDERWRGGGPGASGSNRPTQPFMRSKLSETRAP